MQSTAEAANTARESTREPDAGVRLPGLVSAHRTGTPAVTRAAFIGLALCILALWLLQHPYGGLIQDSVLYAVAASARLHPESLGHDIFLSHGSQDQYTVFSPVVAQFIRLIGVARAAALVTALNQAALYGCALLLARRLMPLSYAILAVAMLVLLPSLFGSTHIFWYTEDIMTPRVPSEALVFAAIGCALGRRYVLAALCAGGAMLLHPLMGMAGIVMLYVMLVGLGRPWLTAVLGIGGIAVTSFVAWWFPLGPIARFDPAWFDALHTRMHYAFPTLWSLRDWGRMSVAFTTLIAGAAATSPCTARSVCRAALATGVCGIALAVIGSDLLHIVIITQIQPWRWLWLSNAVAVLAIPVIGAECWHGGQAGRALLVLLAAAWMSFEQTFVPIIAILAGTAVAARNLSIDEAQGRRMLIGSWAILVLAALFFLGLVVTTLRTRPSAPAQMSLLQWASRFTEQDVRPWALDGVVPAAVIWIIWALAGGCTGWRSAVGIVLLGAASCCAVAPYAWTSWSDPAPSEQVRARFAPWRRVIPPSAQVLAPGVPIVPWFLLDRASYWTLRQMAGFMFSRPTAMELLRREYVVHHFPPARTASGALDGMCSSDPEIGFIVTPVDMGPSPFQPIAVGAGRSEELLHLYRCADHRRKAAQGSQSAPPRAG